MAYRDLVIGDNVKIVKCEEWSGMFGEVLAVEGGFAKVKFSSWRNEPSSTRYFMKEQLLVSTGNPYAKYDPNHPDYEPFEDEDDDDCHSDSQVLKSLLERVAKLEKEMLDMKQRQA